MVGGVVARHPTRTEVLDSSSVVCAQVMRVVSPVVLDATMIVNNVLLLESASSNARENLARPAHHLGGLHRTFPVYAVFQIACILSAYYCMSCLKDKLSLLRIHESLIDAKDLIQRVAHNIQSLS